MTKMIQNHDQQEEQLHHQNEQIRQQKDQMHLILEHFNIKSLISDPTTIVPGVNDIHNNADNVGVD